MKQFLDDLMSNLHNYYLQIIDLMPRLVLGVILFLFLVRIAHRVKMGLKSRLTRQMDDPLLARFLARIARIIILFIALMLFLHIVGLTGLAAGLITGASVSAIVVGFAFKDIVENFLSGVILAFNRPFRVGDTVELNGNMGSVVALHLRSTHIKTFDGKDIYIPNANIVKNALVNYTIDGFIRQEFVIGLDYGSDFNKAIQVVEKELNTVPGILKNDRAPSVLISDLGASTLNLTVYYWLDTFNTNFNSRLVRNEAISKVLAALDRENFYLPGNITELKNYAAEKVNIQTVSA